MTTTKPSSQSVSEHDDSPAVSALMSSLPHPLKVTLGALRQTILAADPEITEGIKWKSPSFHCCGWFVTLGCRKPAQVEVVLHCGAAVRSDCAVRTFVDDPEGLLVWRSPDRALICFRTDADFQEIRPAFQRIVRQWAAYQRQDHRAASAG